MNMLDNQPEFGLSLQVSGAPKGETFPAEEYMKRYLEAIQAHGGLFDHVQAAKFAGVSKVRIGQLVKAGKLRTVTVRVETPGGPLCFDQTIAGNDLLAWMESPKSKGGGHLHRRHQPELQAA